MQTPQRRIVFSFVANPGTSDARVMKQARALAVAGYRVYVFCRLADGFPAFEETGDASVIRFPCFNVDGLTVVNLEQLRFLGNSYSILKEHTKKCIRHRIDINRLTLIRDERRTEMESVPGISRAEKDKHKKVVLVGSLLSRAGLRRSGDAFVSSFGSVKENLRARYREAHSELKQCMLARPSADSLYFARYALFALNLLRLRFKLIPDIIHVHDLYPLPGAAWLAQKYNAQLIFDAHEIETERVPPLSAEKKAFIDQLEHDCFKYTDAIITVCDSSAEFYGQRFDGDRPTVVMNAPDTLSRSVTSQDIRDLAGLDRGTRVVVYTGGVGREARGLDKVAEALQWCPDYHFVILGPRHEKNDAWLMEIARTHAVADRIHMLPAVPADEVVSTIESGDVSVCPIQDASLSYRYALPNKLFEAAFAGLPICVSDLPEMVKLVEELEIGVVMKQTDPLAIAFALKKASANRQNYTLSESGRRLLETKYSWAAQADKLVDLYNSLERTQ